MKERIVVDNRIYLNKEDFIEVEDIITDNLTAAKYTKEQVPETFDELKELCKDNDKIGIGLEFIEYDNFTIVFKREGKILGCGDDLIIAENRTPAQMWNIIKNLIGEE